MSQWIASLQATNLWDFMLEGMSSVTEFHTGPEKVSPAF